MSDPEQLRVRFERLRQFLPVASGDALLALKYASEDPEGSVAKCRRVTEAVLKAVLPADVQDRETLTIEQMRSKVRLPKREAAFVALVQTLGNEGAHHRETRLSPADARRALDALGGLVDWYVHVHERLPRPRRTRWGLLAAAAALTVFGVALVGTAFVLFAAGGAVLEPVAVAVEAAPAPPPVATIAAPLVQPVTLAPTTIAVPLWSRPSLHWEPPPAEDDGPAAPVQRCPGPVADAQIRVVAGDWALATAACGGANVEGWLQVGSFRAAGGTVTEPARSRADHSAARRAQAADGLLDEERWAEAEDIYTHLLSNTPDDAALYRNRGFARLRRGDARAAMDDLAACVVLEPKEARGRCHLYLGEAYLALGDPGWNQVLADALEYDVTLSGEVVALRAGPAIEVARLADPGPAGLPLLREQPARVAAVRRIQKRGAPGTGGNEVCRLHGGAGVDVLQRADRWLRVRVRCEGRLVVGYLPEELDQRPVLAR